MSEGVHETVQCPTCGTKFDKTEAAKSWNAGQKDYCSKHDTIFNRGAKCQYCVLEEANGVSSSTDSGSASGKESS